MNVEKETYVHTYISYVKQIDAGIRNLWVTPSRRTCTLGNVLDLPYTHTTDRQSHMLHRENWRYFLKPGQKINYVLFYTRTLTKTHTQYIHISMYYAVRRHTNIHNKDPALMIMSNKYPLKSFFD